MFKDNLEGKFVFLRKVEIDDAPYIYKWRSGKPGRFLNQPTGYSIEMQEKWILSRTNDEINYIIYSKELNERVGTISIYDVNKADLISDVGRLLLDEKYLSSSNPYGLESMLLCYDYVFNFLNFRKSTGVIAGVNTSMIKLQLFLGMENEGILKKHVFIGNEYVDIYLMSMFKDVFNNKYKRKIEFLLKSFK